MHAVAKLHSFVRDAAEAGMDNDEVNALVDFIAANPKVGDEIAGTGGCRKVRMAGRGKGKSGGYRIVTFFTGDLMPVFLITVFAKGEKDSLSKAERNELRKLTKEIVTAYKARVVPVARKGA